jgi:hypothetical protein
MKYNRDTTWNTLDGREIPIRCLSDVHLANVIHYMEQVVSVYFRKQNKPLVKVLRQEASKRKLTSEFLARAPMPWQDVDGKWKRYSPGKRKYEVIGR